MPYLSTGFASFLGAALGAVLLVYSPSTRIAEVRQAALSIIAMQRQPSPAVLRTLHSYIPHFEAVHGSGDMGCLDRCWGRCHDGIEECVLWLSKLRLLAYFSSGS